MVQQKHVAVFGLHPNHKGLLFMTTKNISVRLKTLSPHGGTSDPLYLGIITKFGGREFALRYERSGLTLTDGQTYHFSINASDETGDNQIFGSQEGEPNNILTYPLSVVERVYLRKEPRNEASDRDDALGVYYVAAFITDTDGTVIDWSNRNLLGGSGPAPFWLGNEFGQIAYLNPENATPP